jgi:predicted permease
MRRDIRLAMRMLARDRGFTILAALALGLGIGVNSTFFSLVNAAVLRGLPIDSAGDVMFLSLRDARGVPRGLPYPHFDALRRDSRAFTGVGAYVAGPVTLVEEGLAPGRALSVSLSASGLDVLRVVPMLGREVRPEDERPGAPAVALLSQRLWQTRYGAQPSVVGRTITINGEQATVIGVMPEGFDFPGNADVWRPLLAAITTRASDDAPVVSVFARLAPGVSRAQAQVEFESFRARWMNDGPGGRDGLRPSVVPINEQFFGRVTDTVWLAFITAGVLVFLIACANVANLLLMRAAARGREVAVRLSLGATRTRIVRQLLIESAVLASFGALAGLALSAAGLRLLQMLVPAEVARLFGLTIDARALSVLLAASVVSVFLFGLAPALHLVQRSPVDVLKQGGRGNGTVARRRWATAFLAAEFALTLVLLANVAEGIRSAQAARDAQVSIDPAALLTMAVTLPAQPYSTGEARNQFFDRLHDTIAALPSVSAVSLASTLPGAGGTSRPVTIAGGPETDSSSSLTAVTVMVGEDYFAAIGVPLIAGRPFTPSDGTPGQDSAIVNARFAELFLPPDTDPLGTLIRIAGSDGDALPDAWLRIVGVAPAVRQSAADGIHPDPVVYLPSRFAPRSTAAVIVRAQGDPAALTPAIRAAIRQLDPSLPVDRVMTMADAMRQVQWNGRISSVLLNGIGTIALLLALVGLYAVTAHSVRLRRQELGIRMALGASRRAVGTLVLRRAMMQLGIGLMAGIGATVAFDRLFITTTSRLTDPIILLPTLVAVVVVGVVACLGPASRAVRLDPVFALRDE